MKSLIGVPIGQRNHDPGVLYLTEKDGGEPFTEKDEILMDMVGMKSAHILERTT